MQMRLTGFIQAIVFVAAIAIGIAALPIPAGTVISCDNQGSFRVWANAGFARNTGG